jgi:hypothetical protein
MEAWGQEALRFPEWNRAAWNDAWVDFMRMPVDSGMTRRMIAMNFHCLGPQSIVAVPALLEWAKRADVEQQYDIRLVFRSFERLEGVCVPDEVKEFLTSR